MLHTPSIRGQRRERLTCFRSSLQARAILLFALLSIASGSVRAAPRVAVIAADGDDAAKLAPLLEIGLQQSGMTLVERAHLDQVMQEQKLQLLLAADSPSARAKLGRLLNANFLVFINCPDKPTRRLEVITCETTQGIRLSRAILPRAESAEKDADAANAAVAKAIAKSAKAGLKIVAVAPWSSDDLTTRFDYRRAAFRRLVEEPLADRDDLVLVEFAEAEALKTELAIAGQPNLVRKQPLILSGRMKHSSVKADAQVTISLELTRGGDTLGTWNSGQVAVDAAAAALPGAATKLVDKAAGINAAAPPQVQANEFKNAGDDLLKLSFNSDAAEMYEAALLLDPENTACHTGAATALYRQIDDHLSTALDGTSTDEERAQAELSIAPVCAPLAERCLGHLEFVVERTHMTFEIFLNLDFIHRIALFVPNSELREFEYNVMKYKAEHGIKDGDLQYLTRVMEAPAQIGVDAVQNKDEDARYIARLTDICRDQAQLRFMGAMFENPQLEYVLQHMEHSDNRWAVSTAAGIRSNLKKTGNAGGFSPPSSSGLVKRPEVPVPQIEPDFELVGMNLPLMDHIAGIAEWRHAGPHADLITQYRPGGEINVLQSQAYQLYCVCDDGFWKNLGSFVDGTGPRYDGKYVWWFAIEGNISVVKVFDPDQDKLWTSGANAGVPPDAIVSGGALGISPGKAYLIGAIGPGAMPSRTWVASATMDPSAGPSIKIIKEFREQGMWGGDSTHPQWAFGCRSMLLMPGSPGAGAKATPRLYLERQEFGDMIMIDPRTRSAVPINDDRGRRFSGLLHDGKLYRNDLTVYDPASDTVSKLPLPPQIANLKGIYSSGATEWKGKLYFYAAIPGAGYFWPADNTTGAMPIVGKIPIAPRAFTSQLQDEYRFNLFGSSVFGMVNYDAQVHMLAPESHPDYSAINWDTWAQMHINARQDPDPYLALVHAAPRHSEKWLVAVADYVNRSDPSFENAALAIDAANFLMSRGDYARAARYAATAARSGAECAIQSQEYPAEGMGDWASAEKYARQAADAYGNTQAWFTWCIRTGHGDLEAARKHFLAGMNPAADDIDGLEMIAVYHMLNGDDTKAQPFLKRLYEEKHDPWGALHAAIYAGAHGDVQTERRVLAPFAEPGKSSFPVTPLTDLAAACAKALTADQIFDKQCVDKANVVHDYDFNNANYVNNNYMLGRILILQGQNDLGITCIKRAAGHNSYGASRALAALYLRAHRMEVPKPGMGQ
jgi:tetratricopeptide (TPR) repeat protein